MNLRLQMVEVCKKLHSGGLIAAGDGNVSYRLDKDLILITPGGVSKADIAPEEVAKTGMDATLLEGPLKPSSEIRMHLLVYKMRPDVSAIVHAHPPIATAFTLAGLPFESKVLPEVWLMLGNVPVAPYATPATEEVARAIEPHVPNSRAILLERHGAVTFGQDLSQAWMRMEKLEHFARTLFHASMLRGRKAPESLTQKQLLRLGVIG
ncbi:MAG: class II aldolase/adducin family protein [Syntrophobacteraceae bacterium]